MLAVLFRVLLRIAKRRAQGVRRGEGVGLCVWGGGEGVVVGGVGARQLSNKTQELLPLSIPGCCILAAVSVCLSLSLLLFSGCFVFVFGGGGDCVGCVFVFVFKQ